MSSLNRSPSIDNQNSSSTDSINRQLFIRNVIEHSEKGKRPSSVPAIAPRHLLPPQEEESILRRSLKDITDDIKKMEDFITVTEDIIRRERQRDLDFYHREMKRKINHQLQNKENKSPSNVFNVTAIINDTRFINSKSQTTNKPATYKINASKFNRKIMNFSPRDSRGLRSCRVSAKDAIIMDDITTRHFKDETDAIIQYITSDGADVDGGNDKTNANSKRMSMASDLTGMLTRTSSTSFDLDEDELETRNTLFDFDCSRASDDKYVIDNFPLASATPIETKNGIEMTKLTLKGDMVEVEVNQFNDDKKGARDTVDVENQMISCFESATHELQYIDDSNDGNVNKAFVEDDEKGPPRTATSSLSSHSNAT